jgi:hypothetical protein
MIGLEVWMKTARKKLIQWAFSLLLSIGPLQASEVIISEFMAVNNTTIQDEDGEYSDWLELLNVASNSVDLSDWFLTDDPTELDKWPLPGISLPPGSEKLIFASNKDRRVATNELHTNFKLSSSGEYLALVRPDGITVEFDYSPTFPAQQADVSYGVSESALLPLVSPGATARFISPSGFTPGDWISHVGFDDSLWSEGPTGIGYEDSPGDFAGLIASIVPSGSDSVYARFAFPLDGTEVIDTLTLSLKYDDGFVAYLNGIKVAESNAPAAPTHNSTATVERVNSDAIVYENHDLSAFIGALIEGTNLLAVHALNANATGGDMLMMPKLSSVDTNVTLALRYFLSPTPGVSNVETGALGVAEAPLFSLPAGFYTNAQSLSLSAEAPGAVIRYTLNGDEPDANSPVYAGNLTVQGRSGESNVFSEIPTAPVLGQAQWGWMPRWEPPNGEVFKATVVRARVYEPGKIPSRIVTRSYFVDPDILERYGQLPVISIASDYDHLFDPATGIYVPGDLYDGTADSGNYYQKWEKPCHIEWFEEDGVVGFSQDIGVRIQGNTSVATPHKGLSFFARSEYGVKSVKYPIFETARSRARKETEFKRFMLRAWGSYRGQGLLYDAFAQILFDSTDLDIQDYRPAVVFVNGEYWGVQELREVDKSSFYYEQYYGIDRDDPGYDILYGGGPYVDYTQDFVTDYSYIDEGDAVHWDAMKSYLDTQDVSQSNHYAYMKTQIDIGNFILHMVHSGFSLKHDWPTQNEAKWRPRTSDGRWRWMQFDCDHCFHDSYTFNMMPKVFGHAIFNRLHNNAEFRTDTINCFADHMNAHFRTDVMLERYDEMLTELQPHADEWHARWPVLQGEDWNVWLNSMSNNIRLRTDAVREHVRTAYGLAGSANLTLNVSTQGQGRIRINKLDVDVDTPGADDPVYPWQGLYYTGVPMTCTAIPEDGYQFVEWQGATQANVNPLSFSIDGSTALTAVFSEFDPSQFPIVISEIMYHPGTRGGAFSNETEFVELYNRGGSPLNLKNVTFTDGISLTFPADTIIAGGERLVVVKDLDAFAEHYDTNVVRVAGIYTGSLANGGEDITLKVTPWGPTIVRLTYNDARGWPLSADGAGHSLIPLVQDNQMGGDLMYPGNWRASAFIKGSPGQVDPSPLRDMVLNEIMAHTDNPDPSNFPAYDSDDWIELYNATTTSVFLSDWYLSDDPDDLKRWKIPSSNIVSALSWISFGEITGFHNPITNGFGLNKSGEQVFLSYLPGTSLDRVADWARFKGELNTRSLGRYVDGNPYWYHLEPTRNGANGAPQERVVISEIMFHPLAVDMDNKVLEYVEIQNTTTNPVLLEESAGAWRLDGGLDYTFPTGTVVSARGYLLIVGFDPSESIPHTTFLTSYGLTNGQINLVGPYSGDLANEGERLALERPQEPDILGDDVSWFIVDEVIYAATAPWPGSASGTGRSLRRGDTLASGRNLASWLIDLFPSPGQLPVKLALSSPEADSQLFLPFSLTLAVAVDEAQLVGPISRVDFFVDDQLVESDTAPPYTFLVHTITNVGVYLLHAAVIDDGGTNLSEQISVVAMTIDNDAGASLVTENSTLLNGNLNGDGQAHVTIYWGEDDGGTNVGQWSFIEPVGSVGEGAFAGHPIGLLLGRSYYYRCSAESSHDRAWAPSSASFSADYEGWSNRMRVTVHDLTQSEHLTNFPVLIRMSTNIAEFSYADFAFPDAADLRFALSDDSEALPFDVGHWDTGGVSEVWVRVPAVAPGNTILWAFWGNPNAGVLPAYVHAGDAWSEGFKSVLHLGDSLDNAIASESNAVNAGSVAAAGILGKGRLFDGINDSIFPGVPKGWYSENDQGLTVSLWARPTALKDHATPFGQSAGGLTWPLYVKQLSGNWSFVASSAASVNAEHGASIADWQQLVLVLKQGQARAYKDGNPSSSFGHPSIPFTLDPLLGRMNGQAGAAYFFEGLIDEFRLSHSPRSDAWILASYLTVASNAAVTLYAINFDPDDTDGDGLEDAWEILHFGDLSETDGDGDSDGDGLNDEGERVAGTDPTNAMDVFHVEIDFGTGGVVVIMSGIEVDTNLVNGMRLYSLESVAALEGQPWLPIEAYTNILGLGQSIEFTAPAGSTGAYYRGKVRLDTP